MRKRLLLYLFTLFVIIVGILWINLYIISSRLVTKERVEAMLQNLIGQPVTIGKVNFSLFRGVEIDNLQTEPDSNGEKFLQAQKIKITYKTTDLLKGELTFENIEIINPELNINEETLARMKSKQTVVTALPTIVIRSGKIYLNHTKYFRHDYRHLLDNVNISFYPFAKTRYHIEGSTEAGVLGKWLITGEIDVNKRKGNLTFFARNLELTDNICEKLSPPLQNGWNNYQPRGKVNFGITIGYQLDRNPPFYFNVLVESLNTTIAYRKFPYKIHNLAGKIEISESGIQIEKISGNNGSAKISLEGRSSGLLEGAGFEVKLSAEGLKLDEQLYESLPGPLKEAWHDLNPAGTIDTFGLITREEGKGKKEAYDLKVIARNCSATPLNFPFPLTNIEGTVDYTNTKITINALKAMRNKSQLIVKGTLSGSNIKKNPFDIIIEGTDIEVNDYALKDAVKKLLKGSEKLWDNHQPEGLVNVTVNLKNNSKDSESYEIKTIIDCKGNKFKYGAEQFVFNNLKGRIEYHKGQEFPEGQIKMQNLTAENEKSLFQINATLCDLNSIISNTAVTPCLFNIKTTNLNINSSLKGIMPQEIINLCKNINFSGSVDIAAEIKRDYIKASSPSSKLKTNYSAEVKISEGILNIGATITDLNGKIITKGEISEGRHHSIGSMALSQAKIEGKRFENIILRFIQENDRLSIHDIAGSGYQGSVNGFLTIMIPDYTYTGQITLSGIDIKDFSRDTFLIGKDISGKIAFEMNLSGKGKDASSFRGQGVLIITEAQLWELPVLLSVFNSFKFSQKSVFERGKVKFNINNNKINISSAKFTSPDIILKGAGTIDENGNLDIQFDIKANSKSIIPVEIVKNLLKLFTQPIYTVKIEGTFKEPRPVIKLLPYLEFKSPEE